MWQAKKDVWPRHAPVLFPIVGKLKENTFLFNRSSYELGQHGFARDRAFKMLSGTDSSCIFELRSDAESLSHYPFDFIFQIRYTLKHNALITHYKVINSSADLLLFSVGAHPGFKCPLLSNEAFEDYYLAFESSHVQITELNGGLRKESKKTLTLPNKTLSLSKDLFEKDALVFENSQIHKISLCSAKSSHKISMECKDWPYFGIWSKKECDEFICLEPWYGIADRETSDQDFQKKEGTISLASGKEFNCSFSVSFS